MGFAHTSVDNSMFFIADHWVPAFAGMTAKDGSIPPDDTADGGDEE